MASDDGSSKKPRNYYVDYTKRESQKFKNRRNDGGDGPRPSKFSKTPDIAFGQNGFLITSIDEVKSYLEMRNILEDYYEKIYKCKEEQSIDKNHGAQETTTEDEVEAELKKLRVERPFKQVKTQCRNNLFIKVMEGFEHVDPTTVVDRFFNDLVETGEIRSSNTYKVLPVLDTCRNSVTCVKESVTNLLSTVLKDELGTKKYFIEFHSKGNYKLTPEDKQKMIEGVADTVSQVRPDWTVDRESADFIIVLNCLKNVCCISFLKDYFKRCKYNVMEFSTRETTQS